MMGETKKIINKMFECLWGGGKGKGGESLNALEKHLNTLSTFECSPLIISLFLQYYELFSICFIPISYFSHSISFINFRCIHISKNIGIEKIQG